jgi:transcriptional regulator with XRE-family HTH domain
MGRGKDRFGQLLPLLPEGWKPETKRILENLRKTRISRKISLLNLANMVEISHSHLYYIESKRVIPSIDVIIKLAKALETNLINLLDKK